MTNPCPGYKITTGYKKPGRLWSAGYHTGVDLAAPVGTKLVAIRSGKVIHVGWGGWGRAYGAHIIIQHGIYRTMVAHLSVTAVKVGQSVSEGQYIGRVGLTGNTTGAHVHVETRKLPYKYNNVIVNPTSFWPTASKSGHPTYLSKLKYGQKDSESVKNLHRKLNAHKMPGGRNLPVTGNYYNMTDDEVRLCQRLHGFGPTKGSSDPKGRSFVGPEQAKHLGLPDIRNDL